MALNHAVSPLPLDYYRNLAYTSLWCSTKGNWWFMTRIIYLQFCRTDMRLAKTEIPLMIMMYNSTRTSLTKTPLNNIIKISYRFLGCLLLLESNWFITLENFSIIGFSLLNYLDTPATTQLIMTWYLHENWLTFSAVEVLLASFLIFRTPDNVELHRQICMCICIKYVGMYIYTEFEMRIRNWLAIY